MQIIMITINFSRNKKNFSFKFDKNKFQTVTDILYMNKYFVSR